jgi:hypothetical protein
MRDDNLEPRDNQQIQDDNQTSGQSVVAGQMSGEDQQPIGIGQESIRGADRPAEPAPRRRHRSVVPERTRGDEGPLD